MPGWNDAAAWGIAGDHLAGFHALVFAPVVIWLIVMTIRVAGRLGSGPARRWTAAYRGAPLPLRAAVWTLMTSAIVHFVVAQAHQVEEPGTAFLFYLDAAALMLVAMLVVRSRRWRKLAVLLLVANLVAYLGYLLAKAESMDQLGMATKLIELAGLGLLLMPKRVTVQTPARRRRWVLASASLVLVTVLTGAVAWATEAAQADEAKTSGTASQEVGHEHGELPLLGMVLQPVPDREPTAAEQEAADRFAAATVAGVAKYANLDVALADGYRSSFEANGTSVHYENKKFVNDGKVMDPARPESLVYVSTPKGMVLVGAMFQLSSVGQKAPLIAGPIVQWHAHAGVCLGPVPPFLFGVNSPFGTCPSGSISLVTPPMIHVWTIDIPGGPYSHLDENDIAKIVRARQAEATG